MSTLISDETIGRPGNRARIVRVCLDSPDLSGLDLQTLASQYTADDRDLLLYCYESIVDYRLGIHCALYVEESDLPASWEIRASDYLDTARAFKSAIGAIR